MKKQTKKVLRLAAVFFAAVIMFVSVPVCQNATTQTAYAAEQTDQTTLKQGLKKEKGKYYFYKNGEKVKNTWKTVKIKGKKYKYYFGKNGAAYAAEKDPYHKYVIVVKTIKGAKYGFLSNGRMVKSGVYCSEKDYVYSLCVFNKNGKLNTKKTKAIRKLAKEGKAIKPLLKKLGKYKKVRKTDSCWPDYVYDKEYYYANIGITTGVYANGKEVVGSVMPL